MISEYTKLIRAYVGLDLAYKNFANDIQVYEKSKPYGQLIYIAKTEAVMKEINKEQERLRAKYRISSIQISNKHKKFWEYRWRINGKEGNIELTKEELLELTEKASFSYWVEKDIEFEPKTWY